jgi:hypothetical protein
MAVPVTVDEPVAGSPGWWRVVRLRAGESAIGRLASFELHLHRRRFEWWVAHRTVPTTEAEPRIAAGAWRMGAGVAPPDAANAESITRHLFESCPEEVVVRPGLADRVVIARPRRLLSIAAHQRATVYAGTPVWVEVVAAGTRLASVPVVRPADTWFGSAPDAGELCYAVSTSARIDLEGTEARADLAITETRIENHTDEPLELSFLRIPAPHLSLYGAPDGRLWTEAIRLEHEEAGEHAVQEIMAGRPSAAAGAERLGEARQPPPARSAIRAFQRKALATFFGD